MGPIKLFLLFGFASIILLLPSITTSAEQQLLPNMQPDAGQIYTSMVTSMKTLPKVGPVSYRVTFEPHDMVVVLRSSGHEAPHVALQFSPNAVEETLDVKELGNNQIEVLEPQSGRQYRGRHVFWAVTWNDARTLDTRRSDDLGIGPTHGEATARSMPDESASSSGATAGATDARVKIIGEISSTVDRFYALSIAPSDLDGSYHLKLKARSDAIAHPLTDLYVDPHTYLPTRLVANFKNEAYISGYSGVLTLSFEMVKAHWLITNGTIEAKAHILFSKSSGKTDFRITDLTFLDQSPTTK